MNISDCARLYTYAYNLNRTAALLHKGTTQYSTQYKERYTLEPHSTLTAAASMAEWVSTAF